MKNAIYTFCLAAVLCVFTACNNATKTDSTTKKIEKIDKTTAKEYTSKYICPMHCEGSGSDEPGTCPVCKMDYELNENYKAHDHSDHDDHEGHDHN